MTATQLNFIIQREVYGYSTKTPPPYSTNADTAWRAVTTLFSTNKPVYKRFVKLIPASLDHASDTEIAFGWCVAIAKAFEQECNHDDPNSIQAT